MQQTRVKPMVEGGVLSAVAIVFAMIGAYVPVLGMFATLIWPVPIILLGVRHGYKWSILALVVSGILIAILMQPLQAVAVVVGFGLSGIVLGYAFRANYRPFKVLLWGSVAFLISQIAVFLITMAVLGVNPIDDQMDVMTKAIADTVGIYRQMGINEEDLAQKTENIKAMIDYMKIIFPAGLVMAAFIVTYINFWAAKIVLKKLGHHIEPFPPFRRWSFPSYTVYVFIAALGLTFWGHSQDITLVYNIGMNLQSLVSMCLLIQGLALFYFLADKYKLSRFIRGIILVLIFINAMVPILAGAFDIAFDYRRLNAGDEL